MLDCIVVGAGLTGLTVATDLVQRGKEIVVLEGRDRIGGRIWNEYTPEGALIEHGGQWIVDGHQRMHELAVAHKLTPIPPNEGDLVVRMEYANTRIPTKHDFEQVLTPFDVADIGQTLMRFRRICERVNRDHTWAEANQKWLSQSFSRWASTNVRIPGARQYLLQVMESIVSTDIETLSLAEAIERTQAGIDLEKLIAINGDLKQYRTEEGIFKILDDLAGDLSDRIHLSAGVTAVSQDDSSVTVTVTSGETFTAKYLVLAIAPQMVETITFTPELPEWRFEWKDKVPTGNVIKAHVVYPKPFWRDQGLSGQMGADEGPVRVTFDTSPPDGSVGIIMGFIEGSDASGLAKRSKTLRERGFVESLTRVFGAKARHNIGYYETDWLKETYTLGSHGAHFAPGLWTAAGTSLAQPEGRVHFCGAEYANRFNGYMEGALISASEASNAVLRLLD